MCAPSLKEAPRVLRVTQPTSVHPGRMQEMDEDVALAALLTALEDLHNIRNEMHACIKQARHDVGGTGVCSTALVP